ncbi:MAG: substrate-binding domain-containing protein, partial [Thermoplasmatales archaeon]
YTSKSGNKIKVYRSVSPGENIAHAGSDFFVGEPLLRKGKVITPEEIALLASSGINSVLVRERMKVGIVSTGNEIVEPGKHIRYGEIFDSNAYYFKAAIEGTGLAKCTILGTLPDKEESIENFIKEHLEKYDVLISSGSTSAGFHDLLYRVIEQLDGKMLFHGISIKPGKPTFLAIIGDSIFLGMPGFPLSAASVMRYIVLPALNSAYGQFQESSRTVSLPFRIYSERGKDQILPAIISRSGRAYPIFGESGSISRLVYADGFVVLKSVRNFYDRKDKVPFFPLSGRKRDLLFIGSNDPLIERVIFDSAKSPVIINAGSWGGVEAMKLGEADISGVHLLKNNVYNEFLLRGTAKRDFVLIRGFSRTQGFVSRNKISSFSEVVNSNLIFVNRNKGSGTRDLIDSEIERELGNRFEKEKIRGYFWEAKSHAAVAKAVFQKRGDVGISIGFYAQMLGLDFHKIRDENYDLLMLEEFYESKEGKVFITKLKGSVKYAREFPGYKFPKNIGELVK